MNTPDTLSTVTTNEQIVRDALEVYTNYDVQDRHPVDPVTGFVNGQWATSGVPDRIYPTEWRGETGLTFEFKYTSEKDMAAWITNHLREVFEMFGPGLPFHFEFNDVEKGWVDAHILFTVAN